MAREARRPGQGSRVCGSSCCVGHHDAGLAWPLGGGSRRRFQGPAADAGRQDGLRTWQSLADASQCQTRCRKGGRAACRLGKQAKRPMNRDTRSRSTIWCILSGQRIVSTQLVEQPGENDRQTSWSSCEGEKTVEKTRELRPNGDPVALKGSRTTVLTPQRPCGYSLILFLFPARWRALVRNHVYTPTTCAAAEHLHDSYPFCHPCHRGQPGPSVAPVRPSTWTGHGPTGCGLFGTSRSDSKGTARDGSARTALQLG